MRKTWFFAAGAAALVALGATAVGCDDPEEHIYTAELFEPASNCLDPYSALDIIAGGDGGQATCAPVCLVGGNATYVSTVCPPYPEGYDTSGTDPSCALALADYATDGGGRYCGDLTDTGVATPTPDASDAATAPDSASVDAADAGTSADAADAADAPTG